MVWALFCDIKLQALQICFNTCKILHWHLAVDCKFSPRTSMTIRSYRFILDLLDIEIGYRCFNKSSDNMNKFISRNFFDAYMWPWSSRHYYLLSSNWHYVSPDSKIGMIIPHFVIFAISSNQKAEATTLFTYPQASHELKDGQSKSPK